MESSSLVLIWADRLWALATTMTIAHAEQQQHDHHILVQRPPAGPPTPRWRPAISPAFGAARRDRPGGGGRHGGGGRGGYRRRQLACAALGASVAVVEVQADYTFLGHDIGHLNSNFPRTWRRRHRRSNSCRIGCGGNMNRTNPLLVRQERQGARLDPLPSGFGHHRELRHFRRSEAHSLPPARFPAIGLYATGNSCGGRFALQYCTPIAGISIGWATTMGKIVGETVAAL